MGIASPYYTDPYVECSFPYWIDQDRECPPLLYTQLGSSVVTGVKFGYVHGGNGGSPETWVRHSVAGPGMAVLEAWWVPTVWPGHTH